MKVGDLIDVLNIFDNSYELKIQIYETVTGKYIDATAAVTTSDDDMIFVLTLRMDVEADKIQGTGILKDGTLAGVRSKKISAFPRYLPECWTE